jgi:hypothetical protein
VLDIIVVHHPEYWQGVNVELIFEEKVGFSIIKTV